MLTELVLTYLNFIRNWKMDWNWNCWCSGLHHYSGHVDIFLAKAEVR